MGFADEVAGEARSAGTSCKTCWLLERMDDDERAEVLAVLADPDVATMPIMRALNRRGHQIGHSALQRHRTTCR